MRFDKKNIRGFYTFSILYFLIVILNVTFNSYDFVKWSATLNVFICMIYILIKRRLHINSYIIWIISFNGIILISGLWAIDFSATYTIIVATLARSFLLCLISLLIKSKEDVFKILKLFIVANLAMAVYILLFSDLSLIGQIRIGGGMLEGWNANYIGVAMGISAYVVFFLMKSSESKIKKYMYLVLMIFFNFMAILSGSRKSIIILIFAMSLHYFLMQENIKKKIKISFFTILLSILGLFLIMTVSPLYNVMGHRIEGILMIPFNSGTKNMDSSMTLRLSMITHGLGFVVNRPFLGYGMNNYRFLIGGAIGRYVYAHANFIELVTGIGVIGVLIYYSAYVHILKSISIKRDHLLVFVYVANLTFILLDITMVSYSNICVQIFICLGFSVLHLRKEDDYFEKN